MTPDRDSDQPGNHQPCHSGRWLVLLGLGSAVLYAATYVPLTGKPVAPSLELRFVMYPLLFGLYFIAAAIVWRQRESLRTLRTSGAVLAGAVIFRALVLSGPVVKNSDNWRYLWEGRVLLAGMNPYAAPPDSPVYHGLRHQLSEAGDVLFDELEPVLNNVRSIYGPIATGLFVLPHWLPFDRIWSLRLIMTVFDLGTVLVIMGLLRSLGRAPALALIYAWNPVCMSSFSDRAQLDAVMVFLVALVAWLMCTGRFGWAGVVFGGALLVKVSPLYLALPLARMGRSRFCIALVVTGALGLIPIGMAGEGSLSGFRTFAARWHNIDSIHALVLLALQPLKGVIDAHAMARAIVMVAAPAYAVWRTMQGKMEGAQWLLEACAAIAAAGVLLSPVVHPWYTAHMLVFLCFAPNPGLLLLTCATMSWFLRFWKPAAGSPPAELLQWAKPFREPWRWVAYPPVFALLIRGRLRRGYGAISPPTPRPGATPD